MTKAEKRYRRLLRRRQVLELIGMGRTALNRAVADGRFPPPIVLFEGGRVLVWDEDEVLAWLDARFAARDKERV
jgi:predicted DNA-binding transcriptional regulator AlpA